MCGISGLYHYRSEAPVDESLLHLMNDTIAHRGPDGQGFYSNDRVGLGHRRLSIIDLAEGDQPIYNEDKSVVIVFNGEIYNYKELRADLLKRGHKFRTQSDTEVIVHLYEDKGIDCLQELNGMFAFSIWDRRQERLFIARDRLGEKPLYYSDNDGRFLFASELKSLLKAPFIKKNINHKVLDDYLAYGYVPAPQCIIEGVKKLPPAHYMVVDKRGITIDRYWNIQFKEPRAGVSEQEYHDEFEWLYRDSVKLRLRSDVPIGAFLSGGIDSSLTVAIAAEQAEQQLSTFSVGFNEQDFDELKYAKIVADQYGTKHHEIRLDELNLDVFPDIVNHFDEPFGDASAIPTYYVTKEAGSRIKVCLSGDAGDELFCGYTRYVPESYEKEIDCIPEPIRRHVFGNLATLLPDKMPGKGRIERMAASGHMRWQGKVGPFTPRERRQLFRHEYQYAVDNGAWLFESLYADSGLDPISTSMYLDQCTYLSEDILVKVDRNSMWHGLEVRVPFLDHRMVEFANALPHDLKVRNGVQKFIIKELLKSKVPESIITRPKKGFGLPLKYWLKDRYYDYTRDLLLGSDSKCLAYFDRDVLSKLVESNVAGKRDLSRRVWTLLCLEQWLRGL